LLKIRFIKKNYIHLHCLHKPKALWGKGEVGVHIKKAFLCAWF
jgi:hypothetical protein